MTTARRRAKFLDVPLDLLDLAETVDAVERAIETDRPLAHLGVNAANLVLAHDRPDYRRALAAADIVSADGQSVVWGARLFGVDVPERVAGIDLMEAVVARARTRGWSIYLLGARRDAVEELARRLEGAGVRVAGHRDGYFAPDAARDVVTDARRAGATILFVGLPSPQKEHLIINIARPGSIPVSIGVGGSFDVLSGNLARAPRFMQRIGLEWLFRLAQEPRRLIGRYTVTNARYVALLVAAAARRRPPSRRAR